MKANCCGAGVLGMMVGAIGKVFDMLISFIVYTGLYWPIFYLVAVLCLWLFGGMTFDPSVELTLFYVGLGISLACSVVLTLRHLIFEPFGRYLDQREEKKAERQAKRRMDRDAKRRKNPQRKRRENDRREDDYGRDEVYSKPPRRERPLVYRSNQDDTLIIYEYRDRFEVYRETPRGLRHIDTKGKRRR